MAKNVLEGKVKNQGTQEVKAPYAREGQKGKTVKHTGKDLRAPR